MDIVRCEEIIDEGKRKNEDDGDEESVENDIGKEEMLGKVEIGKDDDDKRKKKMVGDNDRKWKEGEDKNGSWRWKEEEEGDERKKVW